MGLFSIWAFIWQIDNLDFQDYYFNLLSSLRPSPLLEFVCRIITVGPKSLLVRINGGEFCIVAQK